MKYLFAFTFLALVVIALSGKKETRRQYYALAALSFLGAIATFGTYTTTYIRGYKAQPFQVVALQVCLFILGGLALRIAMRKKK